MVFKFFHPSTQDVKSHPFIFKGSLNLTVEQLLNIFCFRTLDYKRDLTLEHQEELRLTSKLNLTCSDVFFESKLRSDHFGSLQELEELDIEHCKIRTLPPRAFVGLSNLQELSIQTFNSDWSEVLLHIDYEAFVGLDRLESIKLSDNNIAELPAALLCPLSRLQFMAPPTVPSTMQLHS